MSEPNKAAHNVRRGAGEIAEFLFGDAGERRRVYHLAASRQLPVFRLGNSICARESTLIEWIEQQERAALKTGAV